MNENNSDHTIENTSPSTSSSSQPSYIEWKTTSIGEEHVKYRDIEKDSYLKERIEPVNGFETTFGGYRYRVKGYQNGDVSVFRKKSDKDPRGGQSIQRQANDPNTNPIFSPQTNEHDSDYDFDQKNKSSAKTSVICEFKSVDLEEFQSEEGWDIFYPHPIAVISDRIVVIKIKMDTDIIEGYADE